MGPVNRVLVALGLGLLAGSEALGLGVELAQMVPELNTLPAPDGAKEGLRLTYYSSHAIVPAGDPDYYWLDEKGRWVGTGDKDKGMQYATANGSGTGGHGYTQIDIVSVGDKVMLSSRIWGLAPDGTVVPLRSEGFVGPPSCTGDWWVHPKGLQRIPETRTKELIILRMPYTVGDKTFQTIRFQTQSPRGSLSWNYDLETGGLVHTHSAVLSSEKAGAWGGDKMTLGQSTLVNVRQLNLPWATAPPPSWLATIQRVHFEGTHSVSVPYLAPAVTPASLTLEVIERTPRALLCSQTITAQGAGGAPPLREQTVRATGVADLGGLFIPPDAIKNLPVGTVVDQDDITKVTVAVTANGPGPDGKHVVVLTETGATYVKEYTYDAVSGSVIASRHQDKAANTLVQLRLTRAE